MKQQNHFEVSDGDTLIVACKACPREHLPIDDSKIEGCKLCVNGLWI